MKVLLFISAVLTLATATLGWLNRSKFAQLRSDKDDAVRLTESVLIDTEKTVISKINEVKTEWAASKKAFAQDKFAKDQEIKSTKDLTEEVAGLNEKLASAKKSIETMVSNFNTALQGLGISKPEELSAKRDAYNAEVQGLTEEVSKLDKEIEVLNSVLAENQRQLSKQNEVQSQRSKAIALSGGSGLVTAVNSDYGFAIVNMGKNDGVAAESKLLAKRGVELIGKLKIHNITNNLTVVEFDQDKLKQAIQPGDQVIFDSPN
jgi:hypothetical protein